MKRIVTVALLAIFCMAAAPVATFASEAHSTSISQDKKKKKVETVTFKTTIHCKNCVKKVMDNISFEKGVKDLKVNLEEKLVTVSFDPSKTDAKTLGAAISKLGYNAEQVEEAPKPE